MSSLHSIFFTAIVVSTLVVGHGCKHKSGKPADENGKSPKAIKHLRVGLAGLGEINTLDPARAGTAAPITIVWQIFDRLVDVAPDGTVTPMLATSWQSSNDLKEWRFQIRPDVYFHASSDQARTHRVSPADVRASLERALRVPGFGRTLLADLIVGTDEFIGGNTQHVAGIVVSGYEVILKLQKPFAFLPERLAASFFGIVPRDTPEDPLTTPIGSGPFRLVDWQQVSGKIVLERNRAYWSKLSVQCPRPDRTYQLFGPEL